MVRDVDEERQRVNDVYESLSLELEDDPRTNRIQPKKKLRARRAADEPEVRGVCVLEVKSRLIHVSEYPFNIHAFMKPNSKLIMTLNPSIHANHSFKPFIRTSLILAE